ncbi:MAG: sigma-70 family RNA polymerase sigma factor, partial [Clostridia bacterium]
MEVVTGPDSIRDQRLEQLVEQYQQVVLRMCYLYLHDAEQAKDATQESFLKAYLALGAFRGECSDKTWLMRIAINTCRDMRRSAWFRYLDRRI